MTKAEALLNMIETQAQQLEKMDKRINALQQKAYVLKDDLRAVQQKHRRARYEEKGISFSSKTGKVKRGTLVCVVNYDEVNAPGSADYVVGINDGCTLKVKHIKSGFPLTAHYHNGYDPTAPLDLLVYHKHNVVKHGRLYKRDTLVLKEGQWEAVTEEK